MNYHVFIVDKNTFTYHLEYMFAGTGAGEDKVPFISNYEYINERKKADGLTVMNEIKLVGMIADISRIREGDKIIFYLQASNNSSGMFYGVFKANSRAFFDENDEYNFLKIEMGKPLTFRIEIQPDTVYSFGVSEHEYLDSLSEIAFPYQMCWSLIYRKLKGNRGCTMITETEFNTLLSKLHRNNPEGTYNTDIKKFTFNTQLSKIEPSNIVNNYIGVKYDINIKDRLLFKANKNYAFETHLQAYIMQNFDCPNLNHLLLKYPTDSCWIGNEVSCGVGMQRIDIMLQQEKDNHIYIKVIELKDEVPFKDILKYQLSWYVNWVSEYISPNYLLKNKIVHIIPCIIAKYTDDPEFYSAIKAFDRMYKRQENLIIEPVEFISFSINNKNIIFTKHN